MKNLKLGFILIICTIIGLEIFFFNLEPESISEIDNRKLTDFPTMGEGDFTDNVESYVSDRIGFRTWAIDTFTWLNDTLHYLMRWSIQRIHMGRMVMFFSNCQMRIMISIG